jgi:molybdopterin-containing oxidoreductase family membrane subunit
MELFLSGFYSADRIELQSQMDRAFGGYGFVFWIVIACNVCVTQLLWFRTIRLNEVLLFIVSILINVGMWAERFMIVVQSLSHDFVPSKWRMYTPTIWDWATFIGTMGLFLLLFLLFIRVLPMISMAEVRKLLHEKQQEPAAPAAGGPPA